MVDDLIPHNPVRQFVINFPYPLRLWFTSNRNILARVCAIVCSIIQEFLLARASHADKQTRDPNIKTGLLCFVQRFGSSLNLNPHFHIIAMDGAFIVGGVVDLLQFGEACEGFGGCRCAFWCSNARYSSAKQALAILAHALADYVNSSVGAMRDLVFSALRLIIIICEYCWLLIRVAKISWGRIAAFSCKCVYSFWLSNGEGFSVGAPSRDLTS